MPLKTIPTNTAAIHGLHRPDDLPLAFTRLHPPQLSRVWSDSAAPWRASPFFRSLAPLALQEFLSLACAFRCPGQTLFLEETRMPAAVYFLVSGTVRLSISSSSGRRLILGQAHPGDLFGLAAAVSGRPSGIAAEASLGCVLASVPRPAFLQFLARYPYVTQTVLQLLGLELQQACDHLRVLTLPLSAPKKLAWLLLRWCRRQPGDTGPTLVRCSLTHEEIGEHVGVSRETVSRTLTDFKHRSLLEQRGSLFLLTNLSALQQIAGISSEESLP